MGNDGIGFSPVSLRYSKMERGTRKLDELMQYADLELDRL